MGDGRGGAAGSRAKEPDADHHRQDQAVGGAHQGEYAAAERDGGAGRPHSARSATATPDATAHAGNGTQPVGVRGAHPLGPTTIAGRVGHVARTNWRHKGGRMQMQGVDDNIAKSRRMLSAMAQRFEQHKYIMLAIVAVLVLSILFIAYIKNRS